MFIRIKYRLPFRGELRKRVERRMLRLIRLETENRHGGPGFRMRCPGEDGICFRWSFHKNYIRAQGGEMLSDAASGARAVMTNAKNMDHGLKIKNPCKPCKYLSIPHVALPLFPNTPATPSYPEPDLSLQHPKSRQLNPALSTFRHQNMRPWPIHC